MRVFTIETRTYFSDTDATGRASWKSIFDWAEHGRTEMLRTALPSHQQSTLADEDGILTVIKAINAEKKGDAHLDDRIVIETWMERIQRFSCVIGQRIATDDTVVADFAVKAAFIDKRTKHPVQIPEDFRNALSEEE